MAIIKSTEIRGKGAKRPRLYGHLIETDAGTKLYIARRKLREVYRDGHMSISGAMQKNVASWAIDEELLIGLRAKSVLYVGVNVHDTGDLYMTKLSVFFDRATSKLRDYTGVGRGGSRQRYVPLQFFTVRKGIASLDAALY